jgi:transposase
MPAEKVFRIQVYAKKQLAELYHVSLKTLMKWIEPLRQSHPDVFPPKEKDRSHLVTPKQVKLIVEFLGEP